MKIVAAAVLLALGAGEGWPEQPPDQTIEYRVHNTPGDSSSGLNFTVWLEITAIAKLNDTVTWRVKTITVEDAATGDAWSDDNPLVDTATGNWHVTHADTSAPTQDEFAVAPPIIDRLSNHDTSGDDLDVTIEGAAYTPPPGGAPYTITAALSYSLTKVGETDPEEEGEAEESDLPNPPTGPPVAQ